MLPRSLVWLVLLGLSGCTRTAAVDAQAAPSARVIVVGGGLAGLVTAYELQKHGVTSHILEAEGRLGGRVATIEYDGQRAEAGLQELWRDNPLAGLVRELAVPLDPEPGQ